MEDTVAGFSSLKSAGVKAALMIKILGPFEVLDLTNQNFISSKSLFLFKQTKFDL